MKRNVIAARTPWPRIRVWYCSRVEKRFPIPIAYNNHLLDYISCVLFNLIYEIESED